MLSVTPAARPRTASEVRTELEAIARTYALPLAHAAWQDPQASASSAPPAALAWGPGPESSAPPEPRLCEEPAERAFFDSRAAPQPRPRMLAPSRTPRRHYWGARWLPLVLGVVAIAGGSTGYALVAHDEGRRFDFVAGRWRALFASSRAPAAVASGPLAARDFEMQPAWPLIPVARGVAQPELEVQAVSSAAPPPRKAARRVAARSKQWNVFPESRAAAAPEPSSVPDTWDALPEAPGDARRASASDNPYDE
jgi:hypothetical protein